MAKVNFGSSNPGSTSNTGIPKLEKVVNYDEQIVTNLDNINNTLEKIGIKQIKSINDLSKELDIKDKEVVDKKDKTLLNNFVSKTSNFVTSTKNSITSTFETLKKNTETTFKNTSDLFLKSLSPFSLLLNPIQELTGIDVTSKLTEGIGGLFKKKDKGEDEGIQDKPYKGSPKRTKILKRDPGSVLLFDYFQKIFGKTGSKDKKKLNLGAMFGGASIGTMLSGAIKSFLPLFLKTLLPIGVSLAMLVKDFFGEGGALEFFKKGGMKNIGTGIATLLFGKSLTDKSGLQKALGIGANALKFGGIGFAIGGPIGGLIGLALGAGGSAIKLGVESGFFKKIFGKVKDFGSMLKDKYGKEGLIFGSIGLVLGGPLGLFLGLKLAKSVKEQRGDMGLGAFLKMKASEGLTRVKNKITETFFNIRDGFVNIVTGIKDNFVTAFINVKDFGSKIFGSISSFFTTQITNITEGFKDFKADPKAFIQKLFTSLTSKVSSFFKGITDIFGFLIEGVKNPVKFGKTLVSEGFGGAFQSFKMDKQSEEIAEVQRKYGNTGVKEIDEQLKQLQIAQAQGKEIDVANTENMIKNIIQEMNKQAKEQAKIEAQKNNKTEVNNIQNNTTYDAYSQQQMLSYDY